jgi:hypothetical protein
LGRANSQGDVDYFRIDVTGDDPKVINLFAEGLPVLKSNIELLSVDGDIMFSGSANGAKRTDRFSWTLDPGTYYLRLSQAPATIALAIDNSGSMGRAIFEALDAAEQFVDWKQPAEQISLTKFSGEIEPMIQLTVDGAGVKRAIATWREDPDAGRDGGTAIYNTLLKLEEELAEVAGNKAIVILSDGSDSTAGFKMGEFWTTLSNFTAPVFAIGYGKDMDHYSMRAGSTARDALRTLSLATEAVFYDAPTGDGLKKAYAEISNRIRDRAGYKIRYGIAPKPGQLEVLETGGELVSAGAVGEALIIFDASGSMKAKTDAGRQRINVARTVLFDLLEQIPEQVPLGLRLYGHSKPAKPKATSCRDSELVVSAAANNRKQLKSVARAIKPRGQTPIGFSLASAGQELFGKPNALVILLTDGEETCDVDPDAPYNPEKVVNQLLDQGVDVRVNIVGFDVTDPEVQSKLARIARLTGGDFFYAEGQEGLRTALQSAFTAPVEVLDDLGNVVATTKVGDGPLEVPAGFYRLKVGGTDFISQRQEIKSNLATRIYLEKEAEKVRVQVKHVATDAPYVEQASNAPSTTSRPERKAFNPDQRVPETTEELIYKTQYFLTKLGYDPGPADGAMGSKTRRAVGAYLKDKGPLMAGDALDRKGNPTLMLWVDLFSHIVKVAP